mgnify:CR=1 FL=1
MEKVIEKFNVLFKKDPKFDLEELHDIDITEDPVRPELSLKFRTTEGRKIYGLRDAEGDIAAIICIAHTDRVPTTVEELELFSRDAHMKSIHRAGIVGSIAIAYTVWAKKKGGGRHILNEIYKKYKREKHIDRLITLSPLTEMASRFHLKNGAKLLQRNETTQNFEYDITLEQWEKALQKTKNVLKIA